MLSAHTAPPLLSPAVVFPLSSCPCCRISSSVARAVSLVYANKTVADIIVKEMLDEWAAKETASGRKRFTVHYTLDSPPREWDGSTGFINTEMIAAHLPAPSRDTLVLMCGPPPMIKYACKPSLEKLGYNAKEDLGEF